ncbi:MAG: hypothetical protein F6K54_35845 [Okeania sp. SIO3B5]|uniref:hypothetical protein n=1 Tax=Okeania sp. SIO3B5 TaxID=2607811 RepID=UPI0013FFBB39|nr:hypothetical protein [Okeania sp. SIO3B5]NEO57961.1 hypothetical protein [Okeania sp. SIO3B5]
MRLRRGVCQIITTHIPQNTQSINLPKNEERKISHSSSNKFRRSPLKTTTQ